MADKEKAPFPCPVCGEDKVEVMGAVWDCKTPCCPFICGRGSGIPDPSLWDHVREQWPQMQKLYRVGPYRETENSGDTTPKAPAEDES